jgi:hypothetical protein
MCSHSSPDRERRTVPLKRSTADSSIYAGPRWDSATSRITSRGVCSSPVASDRSYTLNYDEPINHSLAKYLISPGDSSRTDHPCPWTPTE